MRWPTARQPLRRRPFPLCKAASEAFVESPLIGQGSWFSRSKVYDNLLQIRCYDLATEAGVGGFVGPNEEPEKCRRAALPAPRDAGGRRHLRRLLLSRLRRRRARLGALDPRCDGAPVAARPTRPRVPAAAGRVESFRKSPFSGAHRVLHRAGRSGVILLVQSDKANPGEAAA